MHELQRCQLFVLSIRASSDSSFCLATNLWNFGQGTLKVARFQKLGLFTMQQKLLILTLLTKASADNAERSVRWDFQIVNERGT
jgi:hypothetical protein